jgi:hypothetical protein
MLWNWICHSQISAAAAILGSWSVAGMAGRWDRMAAAKSVSSVPSGCS